MSEPGTEQLDRLPDGKIPAPDRYVEYDGQVIVRERYSTHQRWKNAGSHDGKRGDPPTILGSAYCRDEDEVLKPKNDHLDVNEIEVYYVDDSESVVYEVAEDDEPEIRADGSGETAKEQSEPDEYATHSRDLEIGPDDDFEAFQELVAANMERLANRVGKPCEVTVRIEVRDLE